MNPWTFLVVFMLPLVVIVGYLLGGAYNFLTPILVFGLIPVLDLILGRNTGNPSPEQEKVLLDDKRYRYITFAAAAVQVGMVLWGAWIVSHRSLGFLGFLGFALSMGISSGALGINVSHELAHRIDNPIEPLLSRIMLATTLYMHWSIEHVIGHHRFVATPRDPATARFGESFWRFLPRTVLGGVQSSWELETARVARKGKGPFSPSNRLLLFYVTELALVVFMAWAFGILGLIYFILQAAVAVGLLEIVNYVEHYGLERRKRSDGEFETVKPIHSWNSSNWFTNYYLFNLERHSDHHFKPGRRYQVLRHFDESPQLPTGYAGMLVLAAVPPLYRKVMDPKVLAHREKNAGTPEF
ncbi:MAG: alkane 1-monooxygenase [Thermodesulfobacteriota bacterium]